MTKLAILFLALLIIVCGVHLATTPDDQAALVTLTVTGAPPTDAALAAPAAPNAGLIEVEKQMLALTNFERLQNGLQPLMIDPTLEKSARVWASHMAETGRLVHSGQQVAENIAMAGWNYGAHGAVDAWMHSPGHRRNMLGNYKSCGVAGYMATSGASWWCIQFR